MTIFRGGGSPTAGVGTDYANLGDDEVVTGAWRFADNVVIGAASTIGDSCISSSKGLILNQYSTLVGMTSSLALIYNGFYDSGWNIEKVKNDYTNEIWMGTTGIFLAAYNTGVAGADNTWPPLSMISVTPANINFKIEGTTYLLARNAGGAFPTIDLSCSVNITDILRTYAQVEIRGAKLMCLYDWETADSGILAGDLLGHITTGGTIETPDGGSIRTYANTNFASSKDTNMRFYVMSAGSETEAARIYPNKGLVLDSATGASQGAGTINCKGVYVNGVQLTGGSAWQSDSVVYSGTIAALAAGATIGSRFTFPGCSCRLSTAISGQQQRIYRPGPRPG